MFEFLDRWFGGLMWCPKCLIWRLPEEFARKTRVVGCHQCIRAYWRQYSRKYRQSEKGRAYYREKARRFRRDHPSKSNETAARYRQKHRGERRALLQRLRLNYPERCREYDRRRRVIQKGLRPGHTLAEWEVVLARWNYQCVDCGTTERLSQDHVVPISRGGLDDISNIVPRCVSCNSRKGNRLVALSA